MKKMIRLLPSEKMVSVGEGETVLAALEKAGYALPNNCRAGACGECKSKVVSGRLDQGFILDMALPQSERDEGYALMCMAKPLDDILEIEYGTKKTLQKLFPPQESLVYIVVDKRLATKRIMELRLRALGSPMKFWPGQYVKIKDKDGKIPERCYSIGNIPNNEGDIQLFITRVGDGATSTWAHDKLSVGEQLKISGPYGTFIGDPGAETPVLCLAAGSGLSPIRSLASAALIRGSFKYPASVLFSARTSDDIFELGHFAFLKAKFRNFDFKCTLTGEENKNYLHGRIPDILGDHYPDLSGYSIYISGPPSFVDDCVVKAKKLGAKDDFIHLEKFSGQTVAVN